MGFKEGRWDCGYCTTTGILGRLKVCPECGDPRNPVLDPTEKPYLLSNEPDVTSSELTALFSDGPDWSCGNCGMANAAKYDTCEKCGQEKSNDDTVNRVITYVDGKSAEGETLSPLPDFYAERIEDDLDNAIRIVERPDDARVFQDITVSGVDDPFLLSGSSIRSAHQKKDQVSETATAIDDGQRRQNNYHNLFLDFRTLAAAAVVLVVLCSGFFIYANWIRTEPIDLTVSGFSWERRIEVEKYTTLNQEDWDYPSDARNVSEFRAIHHYDRVRTGSHIEYYTETESYQSGTESYEYSCGSRTVDNGNGGFYTETQYCTGSRPVYSTRTVQKSRTVDDYKDVPVYRTKYRYQIDRWITSRHLIANGIDKTQLEWPSTVGFVTGNKVGDERIGNGREEIYIVFLHDNKANVYQQQVDYLMWNNLTIDHIVHAQINRAGNLSDIDWNLKQSKTQSSVG